MNTSASSRFDRQMELECRSVEMGVARYRKELAEAGHGALPPGMQLMKAAIEPMQAELTSWLEATGSGLAARSASMFYFVNQLDPTATAYLTAKSTIGFFRETHAALPSVAEALALQVEAALNMEAICAANPALGKKVAKQLDSIQAGKNIALFIRRGAELVDVKVVQWDKGSRIRVGTLLLELFAKSTGLVAIEVIPTGQGKSTTVVRPTETCRRWLEESHARCELLSPVRLPMVCRPRDWTHPFNGGYLTQALRQPLVKTRNKGYLTELKEWDMPWVYGAVNAVQATEWAINLDILDTMRKLWENGQSTAGLPSREATDLPPKSWTPEEEPAPEVLHAWKVEAAKVHEFNAKTASKRIQVVQKLWVAEQMVENGNRFHYVYNLDWRGRLYPVASALSPQGDDSAKALLQFAQSSPLGEDGAYWLAIHGANSFGVDKVSFEERIEWVQAHEEMILECAARPLECQSWAEADAPFTFLAFCFEWARLQRFVDLGGDQELFPSHLAVAFDGACNGLQNFSAMLRDPIGGAATGLVPGHKPADIYSEVARAAQRVIDRDAAEGSEQAQRWVGKMTRKLAKRNTMTVPYGVTKRGMRDQLFGELADTDSKFRGVDAGYLAACNFEAIGEVVVAARQAMDWLKEAAKVASSNALPVRWVTPAGFLAVQDYRNAVGQRVDFNVLGKRYQILLQKDGDELNTRKQALGISPNFVHSLDAAHLMRTVLFCAADGVVDFAMIHDSYGVHAGRATLLRNNLRAAFVEQYSTPVLAAFRDQLAEQLPPELAAELPELPSVGDLDLEQVKQSEYFFA